MKLTFNKFAQVVTLLMASFSTNAASERAQIAWQWIEQGATIIDVRTPGEFASGHLANSQNLPLQSLAHTIKTLDKSKPYVLYCRSGNRSGQAFQIMRSAGFEQLHNGGGYGELLKAKPE